MKEAPILFSGPMVLAILVGRKTQTRRVVKHPASRHWTDGRFLLADKPGFVAMAGGQGGQQGNWIRCPYGQPGDRLWVRETWHAHMGQMVCYKAKPTGEPVCSHAWRPSIYMPRWASRITLEVTAVRVERVQDISEADARAEGVTLVERDLSYINLFRDLWDSINAKRGYPWANNDWVWVVEFRRVA